jgi:putative flippase GtrA
MRGGLSKGRIAELFRFYQAAIANTLFGLSAYALLVRLGLNIYVAQLFAHVMGVTFNYFTYSRHAFRTETPSRVRYVISYAVNYLVSVTTLAIIAHFVSSPYLAGLFTALLVSILNYFALKRFVFQAKSA